jgi:nucleotide-binding universal stress UspA family protein
MSYQTILVHLSNPDRAEQTLEAACAVARSQKSFLIGLFGYPQVFVPAAVAAEAWSDILAIEKNRHQSAAKQTKKIFEEICTKAKIKHEWRELDAMAQVADGVIRHGLCADLLIAAQADPDADDFRLQEELTERIMLEAGRPVLFVPYAGRFKKVGETTLLAWIATREAARAAGDGLAFMKKSKSVTVLSANPAEHHGDQAVATGSQLVISLARHGIEARAVTTNAQDMPVASEILSRASDYGSDLLIMGGYGHSRFREVVFGGVTREILRQMTVPVLMSH